MSEQEEDLIISLHKLLGTIQFPAIDEKPSVAKVHVEMKQECLAAAAGTSVALIKKEEVIDSEDYSNTYINNIDADEFLNLHNEEEPLSWERVTSLFSPSLLKNLRRTQKSQNLKGGAFCGAAHSKLIQIGLANNPKLVLPTTISPSSLIFLTIVASYGGVYPSKTLDPNGISAFHILSFTAKSTSAMGPTSSFR
ncbi:hypothetical protein ACLB2K_066466 [Fragaria x ananassa]